MKDFTKLHRGSDNRFYLPDGSEIDALFPIEEWDCPEAYALANIRGYEPMTAKELESEQAQDEALNDSTNIVEEKFDGTRGIVQFFSQSSESGEEIGYCRVFSRRISKKTNFYTENTDSVPQIRDIDVPKLAGTILDGEMFINGQPFKEVSSTLNCLWDKAVDRQISKGFISLHAFDIIKYKGIDLRRMPLHRRKKYLKRAVEEADSPYIELVPYFNCGSTMTFPDTNEPVDISCFNHIPDSILEKNRYSFPSIYKCAKNGEPLTPRAYYEMIVLTGGEGVIVKPNAGKYHHKRGWEYSKIKKFLTKDCIIMGFTPPTKTYEGKFPNDKWSYWIDVNDTRQNIDIMSNTSAKALLNRGLIPVTRFYYFNMVGNIRYGVIISDEEVKTLPKKKDFNIETMTLEGKSVRVIEVGECSGFDDNMRNHFSFSYTDGDNIVTITPEELAHNKHITDKWKKKSFVGEVVVEIKANELFKDTGKMRHPRFFRLRFDKSPLSCAWSSHID